MLLKLQTAWWLRSRGHAEPMDQFHPSNWANETFAIAKAPTTRYCVMHGSSCDPTVQPFAISTEYLESNNLVVREQLQKAALRLARLLDTALGN